MNLNKFAAGIGCKSGLDTIPKNMNWEMQLDSEHERGGVAEKASW